VTILTHIMHDNLLHRTGVKCFKNQSAMRQEMYTQLFVIHTYIHTAVTA